MLLTLILPRPFGHLVCSSGLPVISAPACSVCLSALPGNKLMLCTLTMFLSAIQTNLSHYLQPCSYSTLVIDKRFSGIPILLFSLVYLQKNPNTYLLHSSPSPSIQSLWLSSLIVKKNTHICTLVRILILTVISLPYLYSLFTVLCAWLTSGFVPVCLITFSVHTLMFSDTITSVFLVVLLSLFFLLTVHFSYPVSLLQVNLHVNFYFLQDAPIFCMYLHFFFLLGTSVCFSVDF